MTLGGEAGDELSYFRQILNDAQTKAENIGYAERRAQEMACGDMEDYSLEGKLTLFSRFISNMMSSYACRGGNTRHGGNP